MPAADPPLRASPRLDPDLVPVLNTLYENDLLDWAGLDASAVRAKFASIKTLVTEPAVALVEHIEVPGPAGGIACRLYHPEPGTPLPLLVWLHGGGWVLGTLDGEEGTSRLLADAGPVAILSVDYRLAPEHPFPAAVEDALACFDWACAHTAQLRVGAVGIGGCSAGGNLAAVVSLERAAGDLPGPAHQLLVYPIADCAFDRASMQAFGEGLVLHSDHMRWFWDQYVPNVHDRTNWQASPIHAEIPASIAPATVLLAACDPLVDEGLAYAAALRAAGASVRCTVGQGLTHGFVGMCRRVPAAKALVLEAIETVAAAMRSCQLSRASAEPDRTG